MCIPIASFLPFSKDPNIGNKNTEFHTINPNSVQRSSLLSSLWAVIPISIPNIVDNELLTWRTPSLVRPTPRELPPAGIKGWIPENGNCAAVCIGFAFRSNNGCRSLPKEEKGGRDKTEVAAIIMIFPFGRIDSLSTEEGMLEKEEKEEEEENRWKK